MRDLAREILSGAEAWIVGGAVRDELLGRPVVDLDIACRDPRGAANAYGDRAGAAVFRLSERHGAWRVALAGGRTVDFTPLRDGIEADLATRDFTINAIAVPLAGGDTVDPFRGRRDLEARVLRAVSPTIFADDPLRLLRSARLEVELGVRLDEATERLVREHADLVTVAAGERILAELERLRPAGFRRLDELGLLERLGGSTERLERLTGDETRELVLLSALGPALAGLPIPNETRRFARAVLAAQPPEDDSPRAIHRFRRATEPWSLEALAFHDATQFSHAVRRARATDPGEPLLRGDELGVEEGPLVGRLLQRIEEERAAGTITTREQALEFVRRELAREAAV